MRRGWESAGGREEGPGMAGEGVEETLVPPYRVSSLLYDRMVGEVLHQAWRENFERLERRYALSLDLVADVACGTGLVTRYLVERGSRVFGVDRSEEMLRVAAARLKGSTGVALLRQDMRYLSLPSKVQTLVCATDSLNHLLSEEDVRRALSSFASALEEGGHLLFDVNTAYQLREGGDETEWSFRVEGWRLNWRSEWVEETSTATLTMHLERADGREGGWVEVHRERAYPADLLVSILEEAGFRRVEVWDAAGLGKPGAKTRRLQFAALRG
ncbi:MAG: class I SAM-dependent methyltransferase [Actinomycetota bacterium]|nr:class I SAM-dependent methyltransferase [Actinomycetota bacterium]MDI7251795.1 class I SAM-dependent methyltransferase [Actinomycetota bacterium]